MDWAVACPPPSPLEPPGLARHLTKAAPAREGGGGGQRHARPWPVLAGGPSEESFVLRRKSVKPSARRKQAQGQLAHGQQFKKKKMEWRMFEG